MVESANNESVLHNDSHGDDLSPTDNVPSSPSESPPAVDHEEPVKIVQETITTITTVAEVNMVPSPAPHIMLAEVSEEVPETTAGSEPSTSTSTEVNADVEKRPPVPPSPSRTAVEALYKRVPRFYKG